MELSQKVVVITGGAKGLGAAIGQVCRAHGARVVVIDRDIAHEANRDTQEDSGTSSYTVYFAGDVTDEVQLKVVAGNIVTKFGAIDIWINNAGVWMPPVPVVDIDIAKARNLFNVNVFGTIHGTRAAVGVMEKVGKGTSVNMISTTAFDGMNGSSGSMYVTSKYALRGFTNVIREELSPKGINVIGVYPGGMKTDIFNEAKPHNIDSFMPASDVADKIVKNLELAEPEMQLIIPREGQKINPAILAG